MWVTIEQGPAAGRGLEVSDRVVIGRDPACDLVLDDDQVSRRHAVMQADVSTVILQDLGSTNGTWVDGQRIDGPVRLAGGEEIRFGSTVVRAVRPEPVQAEPALDQTRTDALQPEAVSSADPHAGLGAAGSPLGPSDFPADPPPPPAPAPVPSVPVPPPVTAAPQAGPLDADRLQSMVGDPAYEYRRARSGVGKLFRKQGEPDPKRLYRVVVGPNGIHWSLQGQAGFARWEDVPWVVQSITRRTVNGAYAGTDHHYALRLANGAVVRISGSEREGVQPKQSDGPAGSATLPITLAKLGSIIQTQVTERQFPLVARAINAGQDVRFGPLTVSAAGIAQGEEKVRWDEIEDVRVHQGVVTVKKAGKWFAWEKAKVGEIPNFFVFFEVVGRLRASPQGPAEPSR